MRRRSTVRVAAWLSRALAYQTDADFEPRCMKYFSDGIDSDFKDELRLALKDHSGGTSLRLAKSISDQCKISTATMSSPRQLLSFYEILGTEDVESACLAASHFSSFVSVLNGLGGDYHRNCLESCNNLEHCGSTAIHEAGAETVPYNTIAKFDKKTEEFVISSPSSAAVKFPLHAPAEFLLVAATLEIVDVRYYPQLFLVRVRTPNGEPVPGVTFCKLNAGVHFHNVRVPRDAMIMSHWEVSSSGELKENTSGTDPFAFLAKQHRLSSAAVVMGAAKRMMFELTHYLCNKDVLGPTKLRDYPVMGLHHIQRALAEPLSRLFVLVGAYNQFTSVFCDTQSTPTNEDHVKLALISMMLVNLVLDIETTAKRVCGASSVLKNSFLSNVYMRSPLLYEGWDLSHLYRSLAMEVITNQYGTKSSYSSLVMSIPEGIARRLVGTPLFTPRSLELGRYLILFMHREVHMRSKLSFKYMKEERIGQEAAFQVWNSEQSSLVQQAADAYIEVKLIRSIMDEMKACTDPFNRRMLRDLGWHYASSRIETNLAWFLEEKWVSPRFGRALHPTLFQMTGAVARQATHLVNSFCLEPHPNTTIAHGTGKFLETELT